jgi:microcystin-dependent protein
VAIIQISRIQQRTGNLAETPQLAAGELGWADDARRLFIGNDVTRAGDSTPNNTEILTQYSNISFNQVASVINPQNYDVVQYDSANAQWINRHIYLTDEISTQATTIHGNLTITGNLNPISNGAVFITGGDSGDVLTTDGTGNLIWTAGGGGGGGTSFTITNITAGNTTPGTSTVITVTDLAASNGDPVIFNGITSTGNIATRLNGNVFYIGNVNVGTDTCQVYTDLELTTGVATTGTYTAGGLMTVRLQAIGVTGAVQLSDGSGHFTAASGLQYTSGSQTLGSPKLNSSSTADDSLTSAGGANIAGNLVVRGLSANIATGDFRVGGNANIIANLSVGNNATVTANLSVSNISASGNVAITGTASISGNTNITGANVSLGDVANVHIQGGTNQVALPGTITVVAGSITGIGVTSGGVGYTSAPIVTITQTSPTPTTPAFATAVISSGAVTNVIITDPGTGYVAANTSVTFSLPPSEFLTTDGRGNLAWSAGAGGGGAITGSITMWPTATAPDGYLICDGSEVDRGTYNPLFSIIGTTFGLGDGSTTFNLPNYTDRFAMGAGGTIVTGAGVTGGSANAVIAAHTHTATSNSVFAGNPLGLHTHSSNSGPHTHNITDPGHSHIMSRTLTDINVDARFDAVSLRATSDDAEFTDRPTEVNTTGISINSATANISINNASAGVPGGRVTTTTTVNTSGVSATNQNLPPYLGIYFIIKT